MEKISASTFSGKMNCSHCHQVLAASAKFCNRCGTSQNPVPAAVPAAPLPGKVCEACQAHCQPQAKFCPQCGHTLGQAQIASSVHTAPTPFVETALPASVIPPILVSGQSTSTRPPRPPLQRWVLAAAVVLAGGGLAWALLKPSDHMTAVSSPQPSAPQTPQIDLDDRAKADALVGPPSNTQSLPPATTITTTVETPSDDAAAPATSTTAAPPRGTEPGKPTPSKPVVPPSRPAAKPEPQASPTLKDLLD